ncbi:MAG TPA: hypothetical protein PK200_01525 [Spirochaetota bacterium]|nr:hypothetical protein [Spirochaetota bacterium]HQO02973.1 hypothetical protein [Spirochaetota bacterium]HQP50071.1 hypothetical protein [Spirochaetota bacterium]
MKSRMGIEKIREEGIDALSKRLGPDGMIRFMQQFNSGSGDYTRDRHILYDDLSIEDIVKGMGSK